MWGKEECMKILLMPDIVYASVRPTSAVSDNRGIESLSCRGLYSPPDPSLPTRSETARSTFTIADYPSGQSLGPGPPLSLDEQLYVDFLTNSNSQSQTQARKFWGNQKKLALSVKKIEKKSGEVCEARKELSSKYTESSKITKDGVPWLKIESQNPGLQRLIKSNLLETSFAEFIPSAQKIQAARAAPAERALTKIIEESGSKPNFSSVFAWDDSIEPFFKKMRSDLQHVMRNTVQKESKNWSRLTLMKMLHDTKASLQQVRPTTYSKGASRGSFFSSDAKDDPSQPRPLSAVNVQLLRHLIRAEAESMEESNKTSERLGDRIEGEIAEVLDSELARDMGFWCTNRSRFLYGINEKRREKHEKQTARAAGRALQEARAQDTRDNARRTRAYLKAKELGLQVGGGKAFKFAPMNKKPKGLVLKGKEALLLRQKLTGGPNNEFKKLYAMSEREAAAKAIQKCWYNYKTSRRLIHALQFMKKKKVERKEAAYRQAIRDAEEAQAAELARREAALKLKAAIKGNVTNLLSENNSLALIAHLLRCASKKQADWDDFPSLKEAAESFNVAPADASYAATTLRKQDLLTACKIACREGAAKFLDLILSERLEAFNEGYDEAEEPIYWKDLTVDPVALWGMDLATEAINAGQTEVLDFLLVKGLSASALIAKHGGLQKALEERRNEVPILDIAQRSRRGSKERRLSQPLKLGEESVWARNNPTLVHCLAVAEYWQRKQAGEALTPIGERRSSTNSPGEKELQGLIKQLSKKGGSNKVAIWRNILDPQQAGSITFREFCKACKGAGCHATYRVAWASIFEKAEIEESSKEVLTLRMFSWTLYVKVTNFGSRLLKFCPQEDKWFSLFESRSRYRVALLEFQSWTRRNGIANSSESESLYHLLDVTEAKRGITAADLAWLAKISRQAARTRMTRKLSETESIPAN